MTRKREGDEDVSALERRLFRAARAYETPRSVKRRAIAVVTAAAGTTVAAGATAGATTTATGVAAGSTVVLGAGASGGTKALGGLVVAAWLMGGSLVASGGYVAFTSLRDRPAETAPATTASATRPVEVADDRATTTRSTLPSDPAASSVPAAAPPASVAPASASSMPSARAAAGARSAGFDRSSVAPNVEPPPQSSSGAAVATPRSKDELAEEIAMLDDARKRLAAGEPAGALAALRRREARFPQGKLGLEAQLVEVDALVRAGRREDARALAGLFLTKHPNHVLAARIRQLVGIEPGSGGTP